MDVRPQSRVIGEIPADVVRVFVDDDLVRIPEPAIHKRVVLWSHAEVEAIEPEALARTSCQPEYVTRSKAAGKPSVLPWMIEVIVRIEAT